MDVSDHGELPPEPRMAGPDAESGRGLFIVEYLADRWGHEAVPTGGKTVWFELRTP